MSSSVFSDLTGFTEEEKGIIFAKAAPPTSSHPIHDEPLDASGRDAKKSMRKNGTGSKTTTSSSSKPSSEERHEHQPATKEMQQNYSPKPSTSSSSFLRNNNNDRPRPHCCGVQWALQNPKLYYVCMLSGWIFTSVLFLVAVAFLMDALIMTHSSQQNGQNQQTTPESYHDSGITDVSILPPPDSPPTTHEKQNHNNGNDNTFMVDPNTSHDPLPPSQQYYNEEQYQPLLNLVTPISGENSISMRENDPRRRALHWLLYFDPLQLNFVSSSLQKQNMLIIQRYIMAVLYYSTSADDNGGWSRCGAPNTNNNNGNTDTCINDTKYRFLSGVPTCDWYGVSCNEQGGIVKLVLKENNLSGTIPHELSHLSPTLQHLILSKNSLTGKFPNFSHTFSNKPLFPNLNTLMLNSNSLTGTIPPTFFFNHKNDNSFQSLNFLSLGNNALWGTLPDELFDITTITKLDLCCNNFYGTLPHQLFDNLTQLQKLHLGDNSFFGTLSSLGFENMSKSLELLILKDNDFVGSLPSTLFARENVLYRLDISNNALVSSSTDDGGDREHKEILPPEAYDNGKHTLRYLDLSGNRFGGSISSRFSELENLVELRLERNLLQGVIPENVLGNLKDLKVLNVSYNHFKGSMPLDVCRLRNDNGNNNGGGGGVLTSLTADCEDHGSAASHENGFMECDCCTLCLGGYI